jgi:hypothetical protein
MAAMSLPPPLVPRNVDLRSMPEMPLEVELLRNASITVTITDAAFRAAVFLWAASWHEVPASSLPDDDRILSMLAGFGRSLSDWAEVRDQALHKFIKCSDGRFYHPVIAQKAIRVWEYRESYRRRMEAARQAKAGKLNGHNGAIPKSLKGPIIGSMTEQIIGSISRLNQTKRS